MEIAAGLARRGVNVEEFKELMARTKPLVAAQDRVLEVSPGLQMLLPNQTLVRGTTLSFIAQRQSSGLTSLAFALASHATQNGSWCAALGLSDLGLGGVRDLGVDLERVALVPRVEADSETWGSVASALIDTCDVVIIRVPRDRAGVKYERVVHRLVTRARQRDAVLFVLSPFAIGDVQFRVTKTHWEGIGKGHGHLQARQIDAQVSGKASASRERSISLWLPDVSGKIRCEERTMPETVVEPDVRHLHILPNAS